MDILRLIKAAYCALSGWVASMLLYFLPIRDITYVIAIAFTINFIFGIVAGVIVQNEGVNFKKAFRAFCEVAVYLFIFTTLFSVGDRMDSHTPVLKTLVVLTWAWTYFYLANWSKNLKRLFPASRGIAFFHYVLNLEFLKLIPYLKNFEQYEKDETKQH